MFNSDLFRSCNALLLYEGEMTLLPHEGDPCPGTGTLELACGRAMRHLRVTFHAREALPELPGSPDGKYGVATSFARIPGSLPFFVFVTSAPAGRVLIGESRLVEGGDGRACESVRLHLLNCLIPESDGEWVLGDWRMSFTRTDCAFDLTRLSLPEHEINLTHVLEIRHNTGGPFRCQQIHDVISKILIFLTFANCSPISAPAAFADATGDPVAFFRFTVPPRTIPTNRRAWATQLGNAPVEEALSLFLKTTENAFWNNVLARAIDWQARADAASYDSHEEALLVTQMLLEMLAYVLLVENAQVISEDGYAKLPAADRITLLCSHSGQPIELPSRKILELESFYSANSIRNIGDLIAGLRNKLIHPTKKNREYLEKAPDSAPFLAVESGLQIATLAILKVVGYKGQYYDILNHRKHRVPWQ